MLPVIAQEMITFPDFAVVIVLILLMHKVERSIADTPSIRSGGQNARLPPTSRSIPDQAPRRAFMSDLGNDPVLDRAYFVDLASDAIADDQRLWRLESEAN